MTTALEVTHQDMIDMELRARRMRSAAIRAAFKRAAVAIERLFHAPSMPAGVSHA